MVYGDTRRTFFKKSGIAALANATSEKRLFQASIEHQHLSSGAHEHHIPLGPLAMSANLVAMVTSQL